MSSIARTTTLLPSAAAQSAREERLLRSVGVWGSWTLVSRVAGFAREVLMASAFGTSTPASALVVAQTVPNLARSLVSEEVSRGALLPVLAEQRSRGRVHQADVLSCSTALFTTIAMLGVSALVWLSASWSAGLLAHGSSASITAHQAGSLLRVLTPIILVSGVGAASSALLVARGRIGAASFPLALSNIPLLVALILRPPSIRGAALLIVAGVVLQVLLQAAFAWGTIRVSLRQIFTWTRELRLVALLALPVALALGASAFSGLVDTAFSTLVGSAGPAALDKAFRLILVPYGVFAVAIGVIATPALVEARLDGDSRFDGELVRSVRLQASILVPAGLLAALFARPIVHLVYERGSFNAASTAMTSRALLGMAFVLPAFGLSLIGSRAWLSRQRAWFPARMMIAGVAVNALLDWALVGPLGLFGIGIATAVVHASIGTVLLVTVAENARATLASVGGFALRIGAVVATAATLALAARVAATGAGGAVSGLISLLVAVLVFIGGARLVGVDDYTPLMRSCLLRPPRSRL